MKTPSKVQMYLLKRHSKGSLSSLYLAIDCGIHIYGKIEASLCRILIFHIPTGPALRAHTKPW